jgi:hypothetical protein
LFVEDALVEAEEFREAGEDLIDFQAGVDRAGFLGGVGDLGEDEGVADFDFDGCADGHGGGEGNSHSPAGDIEEAGFEDGPGVTEDGDAGRLVAMKAGFAATFHEELIGWGEKFLEELADGPDEGAEKGREEKFEPGPAQELGGAGEGGFVGEGIGGGVAFGEGGADGGGQAADGAGDFLAAAAVCNEDGGGVGAVGALFEAFAEGCGDLFDRAVDLGSAIHCDENRRRFQS